jgi:hypothetical protein
MKFNKGTKPVSMCYVGATIYHLPDKQKKKKKISKLIIEVAIYYIYIYQNLIIYNN